MKVHYTQQDREEFYRRARLHGNGMNSLGEMRGEMRVQSFDNAYARFKYAQMQRDQIQLEEGRRLECQAQADYDGALAQASNFIGDVFCGGAQRNLDDAYEAAEAGRWKQAAQQFATAGVKVAWEGVKEAGVGMLARGLNLAATSGKLGNRAKTMLGSGKACKLAQKGESLHKAEEVHQAQRANASPPR